MLTVKDIIRKEISAADPSVSCVWDSGIDGIRAAWVHPGGLYTLLLTKEETEEFKLDMYQPVYHAEWIKAAWEYSRLQENFNSFSVVLGGKKRKLWFNMPSERGDSIPHFSLAENGGREDEWYYYPLANTLYSRLKVRYCDVYQGNKKPRPYFLATNGRPYAMIMPLRLASPKKDEV